MNERVGKPTGLSQAEPVAHLGPSGFDPSRGAKRREEAKLLLPFFTDAWEPLRDILRRAGEHRSASQMVSRARELETSGAVESRWESAMKVWRRATCTSETQEEWLARISAEQNRLRLVWLANAVLACDYGDNDTGQIGWRIRADAPSGGPLMFGPSINAAIDNAIATEARRAGTTEIDPVHEGADPKGIAHA